MPHSTPVLSLRNRRSSDTNLCHSPGKHRPTALGGEARGCSRAGQSTARILLAREKLHTEQTGKISAHHRAKATPLSSCWTHTPSSSIQVPKQEPRSRRSRKCLFFASFTHLAPEFPMAGRKGKAGICECYSREFSKY